ncbi:MAG: hypothetical protein WCO23_00970 [bacterium]
MKKLSFIILGLVVFAGVLFAQFTNKQERVEAATTTLSTNVLEYLTFSLTSGDTVPFGDLTPGTPIAAPSSGTVGSVTTNSANGYTIGLSDGSGTNSALLHTDTTTYIPDYAGTIAVPTTWTGVGVGISLFAADTSKEAKWGSGTTYDDSSNKYAGVPAAATTAHTVTGYHEGADTSSWAFKIDVANSQKTGAYSGDVTFTATATLI